MGRNRGKCILIRFCWLALCLVLGACGRGEATVVDPTPGATTVARASALAATATTIASAGPPGTPDFHPANPRAAVATAAATPILDPSPTSEFVPKEGTPRAIPGVRGQRVLVDDRYLWIACSGAGSPTVVMDAGVNSGSQVWSLVWPATASATRVCVYDRAGLGNSDPIPRPRTSEEIVADLHGLLQNAGIEGPYVMVAHSFGGLNIRLYASRYPTEVLGMVLVDAVHEDRFAATAKILTPAQEREFEQRRQANPEGLDYFESSRLVRALGPALPDFPLIVIARGQAEDWPRGYPVAALEKSWRQLQADLASRGRQGKLVIAEKSDHNIPGHQPDIVVEAVRQVVQAVRDR